MRHRRPGPYQVQAAIARAFTRGAARAEDTDWAEIDQLYATLERLTPSPVVTLNRAVAVSKVRGPAAALEMIEPLAPQLSGYFHFFGLRGALLLQLGRAAEARVAFDRAIALANTPAEAAHIRMHLDQAQSSVTQNHRLRRRTSPRPHAMDERKPRRAPEQRSLARVAGQRRRALELGARLVEASELGQQIAAHARQQVVAGQRRLVRERVDERQPGGRPVGHADRDRAVELDDRRRRHLAPARRTAPRCARQSVASGVAARA